MAGSEVQDMQRIFTTLAIMVCALPGLVACQSGEKILTRMVAGDTPVEAFAPTVDSSRLIFVVPVDGMPDPARLVLADAVAASLRDAKKPAIIAEKVNELGPTIAGRIVEVNERGTVAWVTMVWELRAPYGTAVAEYRQQVVVDSGLWKSGSAEAINVLVFDAGPKIIGMVHDFVSPVAVAETEATPQDTVAQAPAPVPVQAPVQAAPPIPTPKPSAKSAAVIAAAKKRPPAGNQAGQNEQAVAALTGKPAPARTPPPPAKAKKNIGKPMVLKKVSKAPDKKETNKSKPVLMPVPKKGSSRLTAAPPSVAWGRPAFLIKPVKGAPGDGNKALTMAIKQAL